MAGIHDGQALARAQEQAEEQAEERAAAKLRFYKLLAAALGVPLLCLAANLLATPGRWWFFWPALGLGLGLAVHGCKVFGGTGREQRPRRRLAEKGLEKQRRAR